MQTPSLTTFLLLLWAAVAQSSLGQQQPTHLMCSLPEPTLALNKPNIFSAEQEQWLGAAQAKEQEPDYVLLPEKDSAELTRIGQKLLAQLPPTPIRYRFRVYESEEANAFSAAGGYVYVSSKLISDARNEDELAGVLAHEIGHIYTHQLAIEYTQRLKERMNVTSVGSEADIDEKIQLLLNVHVTHHDGPSDDELDKDEFMADRLGMYAMVRAGYAPRAFAENLDRISANKGRLGSFLTDWFDINSIATRRVRAARSLANELPADCKALAPGASAEFKEFQEQIRSAPVSVLVEPTPGLKSFKMDPPMRPALEQVRFSPDGGYVLAQDETRIHVISRSPMKLLFSIYAPGAEMAHFTPHSKQVAFHYSTMRVERWDVATGTRAASFELVDYRGCAQTSLSPDGKTLVCLSTTQAGVWLKMMDVDSGKLFYDNKNFYDGFGGDPPWSIVVRNLISSEVGTVAYSQDGRTMVIATGSRAIAYDLVNRKPINMTRDLSAIIQGKIAFVDSNKLVFDCDIGAKEYNTRDTFTMCETTFPDGFPINRFQLGYQWVDTVAHGNHVLIGPLRESASALVDPSTGKASATFKLDALDLYDQTIASETERGGVTVSELGSEHMGSIELPLSPLPTLAAAQFSPDGRFLAISDRLRSSIWDLKAEKQVALMRPFRAVSFEHNDQMFAQYQDSHQKPGKNSHIDLKTGKVSEGAQYDAQQLQHGEILLKIRTMDRFDDISQNTEMSAFDRATGVGLWKKRFPHETPIVRDTDGDALLLLTNLSDQTATDETAHSGAKFIKASDKKGEWIPAGMLVEVIDARTGEARRQIAVPEFSYEERGFDSRSAALYGDFLVVHGNYNNSVIYRVSDGMRLGAFYGTAIAGDSKMGLIAAINRIQDVSIYDARTGAELKAVTLDHSPRAARFVPDSNRLLVLTANESVYFIDLPAPKSELTQK